MPEHSFSTVAAHAEALGFDPTKLWSVIQAGLALLSNPEVRAFVVSLVALFATMPAPVPKPMPTPNPTPLP